MPDTHNTAERRMVVAPMMELTDRHYRYLACLLTRHTFLYTEMLTCQTVIHGDRSYLIWHAYNESPVVLQLGSSDVREMAAAAAICAEWGYDEINMNVGCPSDRLQAGRFSACLMAEPELVRNVVSAMRQAVKCRLGIDRDDSYKTLHDFVKQVSESGCKIFIVHAHRAWLDVLSPKENRRIPPLRYEYVHRLKQAFPHLHISINGGIETLDAAQAHLQVVDGVMIGHAAYYHPAILADADRQLCADLPGGSQATTDIDGLTEVARQYALCMQGWIDLGIRTSALSRHLVSLFQELPGPRLWRRHLSEQAGKTRDAVALVEQAVAHVHELLRRSA